MTITETVGANNVAPKIDPSRIMSLLPALILPYIIIGGSEVSESQLQATSFLLAAMLAFPAVSAIVHGDVLGLLAPLNLVRLGSVYWILLDTIQALYVVPVAPSLVKLTFQSITSFNLALETGALLFTPRRSPIRPPNQRIILHRRIFGLAILATATYVLYYLGKSDWQFSNLADAILIGRGASPWARGAAGDANAALEGITYFGYTVPTLAVLYYRSIGNRLTMPVFALIAFSCLILLLLSSQGARRTVGVVAISPILLASVTMNLRLTAQKLLRLAIAVTIVLLSMNLILQTRGAWTTLDASIATEPFVVHVDDNFLRLAQTIDAIPSYVGYAGWSPITFALIRPIPRILWPGKPLEPSFTIHGFLGVTEASLSNSAIGELYSSFGWVSILCGGAVFGALSSFLERRLRSLNTFGCTIYALGSATLFVGVRSLIDLVALSYPTFAGAIILWTCSRRRDHQSTILCE